MLAKNKGTAKGAVLVMTDLVVLERQERLLAEIVSRDMEPLVLVGPTTPMTRLEKYHQQAGHPLSVITSVVQVGDSTVDTVVVTLQPMLAEYDIQAVLSCGEVFVEPAGVVAECLALPGPSAHAARVCRNKILQRLTVPKLSPKYWAVAPHARDEATRSWSNFPAVVKPTKRMYSSGVERVDRPDDLRRALNSFPADEFVLIEELVTGPEYSVESFVQQGRVLWAGVTRKSTNENLTRFFTETSHTCPGVDPDDDAHASLIAANDEVLHRVGVRDGLTHAEFRWSNGRAVMMEVACRVAGDAITMLWHMSTGLPIEPVMLDLALGREVVVQHPSRRAKQIFVSHPHGKLRDVKVDGMTPSWIADDGFWPHLEPVNAAHPPRCCAVLVHRKQGDLLGVERDSSDRSVSFIVDAPLDADIESVSHEWERRITVVTT